MAYRQLARQHHPDVAGATDGAEIHAVNEAYRVLGDPGRRVVYDRSLRDADAGADADADLGTLDAEPGDPAVVRATGFPWRGFAVATTVAVIAVAAASLFSRPSPPPTPDGILQPGSCVTIEPNGDAREALCTGTTDVTVRQVVPSGVACPIGTRAHRDHQGQGTACLDFPTGNLQGAP